MKKQVIQDPDDHLVIHDVAAVTIAGALGIAGAIVTGSPEIGAMTTGIVATTGIGSMRIGPIRRGVNSAAMAMAGDDPKGVNPECRD